MLSAAKDVLARILDARGEAGASLDEMRSSVQLAREFEDRQVLWPALIGLAWCARRHGLEADREAALSEVVAQIAVNESVGDPQEWHLELVLELDDLGRDEDARALVRRVVAGPWADACAAAHGRRYADAADVLASLGNETMQAQLRLLAARQLTAEGRLAEAEAQLERARAFWRRVNAQAYLREADEVLAAAS